MHFFKNSIAIFTKEVRLEIRSKYGINTVLAFVVASLLVVLFALRADDLHQEARSGLIWIIILFASMASLPRSFVAETDQRTFDTLRLHFSATPVFTGKLLYNFLFTLTVSIFTLFIYLFLMNLSVVNISYILASILFGSLGLSGVSTLLAALVSRSSRQGALFSVLCIPLLIPLILIVASTTYAGFYGDVSGGILQDLMALIGFCGVTITAGSLLFDFIWDD